MEKRDRLRADLRGVLVRLLPSVSLCCAVAGMAEPVISRQPVDQEAELGASVVLSVQAAGIDPIRYQWRYRDAALPGAPNAPALTLSELTAQEGGPYSVVVSDETGSGTRRVARLALYVTLRPIVGEGGLSAQAWPWGLSLRWNGGSHILQSSANLKTGRWTSDPQPLRELVLSLDRVREAEFFRLRNVRSVEVKVFLPAPYDAETLLPLVVVLHGRTPSMSSTYANWDLAPLEYPVFFCYPMGLYSSTSNRYFWNGTDYCCDLEGTGVDDVSFLSSLIQHATQTLNVDPRQIYIIGSSNGGFMAYRMACEASGLIAGVASVSGATFKNSGDCEPTEPVNVLQIHGTADETISYTGGEVEGWAAYPGAEETIAMWGAYNGCSGLHRDPAPTLDLQDTIPGLDTVVTRFTDCPDGGAVELWAIQGGTHAPGFNASSEFVPRVLEWLLAHPKP